MYIKQKYIIVIIHIRYYIIAASYAGVAGDIFDRRKQVHHALSDTTPYFGWFIALVTIIYTVDTMKYSDVILTWYYKIIFLSRSLVHSNL